MDIIIGWQKYETEFSGGKVGMELRPLSREAMLLVSPQMAYFAKLKDGAEPDEAKGFDKLLGLQGVCAKVFPAHVKEITGIMVKESADAQAVPVTIEQITYESMFAALCTDIMTKLFTMSVVSKDQAKN